MKLRVLIVDDEHLARERLKTLLADCLDPAAEVVGEAGHAAAALDWLSRHSADVVLLDIHMPGLDGLELARRLATQPRRPALIFVTAHAEHALAAFEVEAVDYLTKPVRRLRLQQALARAVQRLPAAAALPNNGAGSRREASAAAGAVPATSNDSPDAAPASPPRRVADQSIEAYVTDGAVAGLAAGAVTPSAGSPTEPAFVVHSRAGLVRVPLAQVLYLKAEQKYVTVRTAAASHLIEASLTELEARLGPRFLRVHRNAIVARTAIRELRRHLASQGCAGTDPAAALSGNDAGEAWAVCVDPLGEWLAVSRRQLAAVRAALAGQGL